MAFHQLAQWQPCQDCEELTVEASAEQHAAHGPFLLLWPVHVRGLGHAAPARRGAAWLLPRPCCCLEGQTGNGAHTVKADETRPVENSQIKYNCYNLCADFCNLAIRIHTHRVRTEPRSCREAVGASGSPCCCLQGRTDFMHHLNAFYRFDSSQPTKCASPYQNSAPSCCSRSAHQQQRHHHRLLPAGFPAACVPEPARLSARGWAR